MDCDCDNCTLYGNCQYCNDTCSFGYDGAYNYTNFISR